MPIHVNDQLGLKKLSATWVPRSVCLDYKRVTISKICLELYNRNPNSFFRRFPIVNETRIWKSSIFLGFKRNNPHRLPLKREKQLAMNVMTTYETHLKRIEKETTACGQKNVLFH